MVYVHNDEEAEKRAKKIFRVNECMSLAVIIKLNVSDLINKMAVFFDCCCCCQWHQILPQPTSASLYFNSTNSIRSIFIPSSLRAFFVVVVVASTLFVLLCPVLSVMDFPSAKGQWLLLYVIHWFLVIVKDESGPIICSLSLCLTLSSFAFVCVFG